MTFRGLAFGAGRGLPPPSPPHPVQTGGRPMTRLGAISGWGNDDGESVASTMGEALIRASTASASGRAIWSRSELLVMGGVPGSEPHVRALAIAVPVVVDPTRENSGRLQGKFGRTSGSYLRHMSGFAVVA